MILEKLKFPLRRMKRQGVYSFINIFGLAIGLASIIMIGLWIVHEYSYEKIYSRPEQIHQVYKTFLIGNDQDINESLPYLLGETIIEEVPEVMNMTRVFRQRALVSHGDLHITESSVGCVDSSYFSIFDHRFILGDASNALKGPQNAVVTRDIATKYFGPEDPIGRILTLDHSHQYVVSGVIDNIPDNTYMDFSIFIPIETALAEEPDLENWYSHFIRTYVILPDGIDQGLIQEKLTAHIRKYMEEDATINLVTQPITEKHLNNLTDNSTRQQYVSTFLIVGILILIIACINYMNLSSAISARRSKEISLKKVVGANRRQLSVQILGESLFQTFLAMLAALVLVETLRPVFNELSGKNLEIPYLDPWFITSLIVLTILTALLSGAYPSLLLSSFKPADVFRGRIFAGRGALLFRKTLVVVQFSISIGLIICSLLIYSQLRYVVTKDIGFEKENLISLPLAGDLGDKYEAFKNDLTSHTGVMNVCRTSTLPSHIWNIMRGLSWEGNENEENHAFAFAAVDEDYIATVGLTLVEGRNFSKEYGTDTANYIINEAAARMMGFEHPINKKMGSEEMEGTIIGVVRDFNSLPLQYEMEPLILRIMPDFYWRVLVRIRPEAQKETLAHLEAVWNDYAPGYPFEHTFVEERIAQSYKGEGRIGKLSLSFTILAILITCIGLFGLAAHMAQQKTREIGIRKVFGASIPSILIIFIRSFAGWVLLANVIAWPLAYLFIKNWLNNFAYRVEIAWYIFVLSGLMALVIAVLTVSYQSFLAANRNPVLSLRYE